MIIDCHGHFTTVPASFREWRAKQIEFADDPLNAPPLSGAHVTDEQIREPAPIHQDEGRRLPQGWRIIVGVVVLLLGYGVWHLMAPGGDANQTTPPPPMSGTFWRIQ